MFAAAATYDYHLVAGSPCVDAGRGSGDDRRRRVAGAGDAVRASVGRRRAHDDRRPSTSAPTSSAAACRSSTAATAAAARAVVAAGRGAAVLAAATATVAAGVGAHGCSCQLGAGHASAVDPSIDAAAAAAGFGVTVLLLSLLSLLIRWLSAFARNALTSSRGMNIHSVPRRDEPTSDAERRSQVRSDSEGGPRAVRRARLPRHAGAARGRARRRRRRHDLPLLRVEGGARQRALPALEADHRQGTSSPTSRSTRPAREQFRIIWARMADFALAHPRELSFLELHHHGSYLDKQSLAIEHGIIEFGVVMVRRAQEAQAIKKVGSAAAHGARSTAPSSASFARAWRGASMLDKTVYMIAEQCCWEAIRA